MSNVSRGARLLGGAALLLAGLGAGCASVDASSVQAQAGAPLAAEVPVATIPFDPNLPRFVVAVEPFGTSASGQISGSAAPTAPGADGSIGGLLGGGLQGGGANGTHVDEGGPGAIGPGVSAQLITALSNCGNISIITPEAVVRNPDGTFSCKLQPGEVGPFIVKGAVTEFNETADLKGKKRGGSLGLAGVGLGLAGAITGSQALGLAGTGVAVANPTYENEKVRRSGAVGLDVQVIDGRSGRLMRSFNSSGTFTSESATSGMSLFGIGGGNAAFAASALGQATRAAMNDALQQTFNTLIAAPR